MVKVSISLPNNAQITFESEESEVLHEVLGMVLRDLPKELMQSSASDGGDAACIITKGVTEKSTDTIAPDKTIETMTAEPAAPVEMPTAIAQPSEPVNTAPPAVPESTVAITRTVDQTETLPPEFLSESGRSDFVSFCQHANPLGDMRRVVVAAVGANRHFGVDGVNASDLAWLFDAARWRKPGNFTQTLRNAARSKFGWLERIPGRSGRYAATPLGISKTLTAE